MENVIKTIQYGEINQVPLEASFIQADDNRKNMTIIYIHGGGLVYGHRMDLPDMYIQQLTAHGYDFFSIDYPLAPETKLGHIIQSVSDAINWFIDHAQKEFNLQSTDFILFGRSSGAYLSLLVNKGFLPKQPKAIISLYGYYSLMNGILKGPNRHYLKFPKFQYGVIQNLISDKPIVHGELEKRYSLYVYYRQTGKWVYSLLNETDSLSDYSLTEEELKQLPPTFLTASTDDQDVPYQITEKLSKIIPVNELFTVHGLEHDYDRNTQLPESTELYERMVQFLEAYVI